MQYGCIFGSSEVNVGVPDHSLKIYSLNAESWLLMNQFVYGAISLDLNMPQVAEKTPRIW